MPLIYSKIKNTGTLDLTFAISDITPIGRKELLMIRTVVSQQVVMCLIQKERHNRVITTRTNGLTVVATLAIP